MLWQFLMYTLEPSRDIPYDEAGRQLLETIKKRPSDGHGEMIVTLIAAVLFWFSLYYLLCFTDTWWMGSIAPSPKPHENNRYWRAKCLISVIHAIIIVSLGAPAAYILHWLPEYVQYCSTNHLGWCGPPEEIQWHTGASLGVFVAFSGTLFTAFTVFDTAISVIHRLSSWDYVLHHSAFIVAGFMMRGNCILNYNAAACMVMEVSSPFLNIVLFFRNRGDAYANLVTACAIMFVLTFIIFRLGLNTYQVIHLWQNRELALEKLPPWQAGFLLTALTLGAGVQYFWFPAIMRSFSHNVLALLKGRYDPQGDMSQENTGVSAPGPEAKSHSAQDAGAGGLRARAARNPDTSAEG